MPCLYLSNGTPDHLNFISKNNTAPEVNDISETVVHAHFNFLDENFDGRYDFDICTSVRLQNDVWKINLNGFESVNIICGRTRC
jgi:hypothetical protein